jgi:phycobilisome core component
VRGIALLADVIVEMLVDSGVTDLSAARSVVAPPFGHLCQGLAPSDLRAR